MLNSPPLNNSLLHLVKKHGAQRNRFTCTIKRVNYVAKKLRVVGQGYDGARQVGVSTGMNLGTPDRPIVFAGDIATVERQPDHTYICISVKRKIRCATSSDTPSDVEVNTSTDEETSNSDVTQDFGSGLTRLDLMIPPFEPLGDLALPDVRLPETLCGIPLCCTDAPLNGQTLVYDSGLGCLKWDFKDASCPVYFKVQEAILTSSDVAINVGGTSVSIIMVGHHVYVLTTGYQQNIAGFAQAVFPALLYLYNLIDPLSPVLVSTTAIDAGDGTYFANVDMGARGELDALWMSGVYITPLAMGAPVASPTNPPGTIRYYDISNRELPTLNTEFAVKLGARWAVHRHFDGVSFSGNPYLVGLDATGQDTLEKLVSPIVVIDGYSGSTVGTVALSGTFTIDVDPFPFILMCDNVALVQFGGNLNAINLTTPSSPSLLWSQAGADTPTAYLGSNAAYVTGFSKLYIQVNVDGTNAPTDSVGVEAGDPAWFFLVNTCLYAIRSSAATSYRIKHPLFPRLSKSAVATIPITVGGTDRTSASDFESARLLGATVGVGGSTVYLTVFSSTP